MKKFLLICCIILGQVVTAEKLDGHLVTQHMAIEFNSMTPINFVNRPVKLKQYFVPKEWTQLIVDQKVEQSWNSLISDPAHPGFVRILIHPFDQVQSSKIEEALKKHNLPSNPSYYEVMYNITESRSLYPTYVVPGSAPVSPRLSMSHGFGLWNGNLQDTGHMAYNRGTEFNKLISSKQAEFSIYASRLIQNKIKGVQGRYFEIQPERMVLTVQSPDGRLNLGETFRDISSSVQSHTYLVPGFVGNNLLGGHLMALANGYSNAFDYLKQEEARLRGRALAEFFILTGFVHSSPHSQNFLISTNDQFETNGRLIIRDLPDLIPTLDSRNEDPAMASLFHNFEDARQALQENLDGGADHFAFRHSLAKGNDKVLHLSDENLVEIEKAVSDSFIQTLAELSGVEISKIKSIAKTQFSKVRDDYAVTLFDRNSATWNEVLKGMQEYRKNYRAEREFRNKTARSAFTEKNEKINQLIKKVSVKVLKGEVLNSNDLYEIQNTWAHHLTANMNSQEYRALILSMLTAGVLPKVDFVGFIQKINQLDKESDFKLFDILEHSLLKTPDFKKISSLLDFIKDNAERLKLIENYFERVKLERLNSNLVRTVANNLEKFSPSEQIVLTEKLFDALASITEPKYLGTNLLPFYFIGAKLKGMPESIIKHIMNQLKNGEDSILTTFVRKHPVIKSAVVRCELLF